MLPSNKMPSKFKWKSDFDKSVVLENFSDRNWTKSQGEGDYFSIIRNI